MHGEASTFCAAVNTLHTGGPDGCPGDTVMTLLNGDQEVGTDDNSGVGQCSLLVQALPHCLCLLRLAFGAIFAAGANGASQAHSIWKLVANCLGKQCSALIDRMMRVTHSKPPLRKSLW